MNFETVGVIGAGVMGSGIAQMFAEHDFPVLLCDASGPALDRGVSNIKGRLEKSAEKGSISAERVPQIISRIRKAGIIEDFKVTSLIIEAVTEDLQIKKSVLSEISRGIGDSAVIGTNTSSLCITDLAGACHRPERFLGIHFFNPPTRLELVEVIPHAKTIPSLPEAVCAFLKGCGKTPVLAKDSPGFIVNRLLLLMINEAGRMVDEGVASPEDIDTAMRLGALHPAGPLAVADLIGLDTCASILDILRSTLHESSYEAADSIKRLVQSGKLGRKTGEGFFRASS